MMEGALCFEDDVVRVIGGETLMVQHFLAQFSLVHYQPIRPLVIAL